MNGSSSRRSCIAENYKVLGKDHHHIRLLPQQVLAAEPFGVVFDPDAAGVLDFHVGVLCLKLFNGGVNKGIVVLARDIPIAVTREALALLFFVGMAAGFMPAVRAMKLSPLAAIRNE